MKSHVITKLILGIVLLLTFSYLLLCVKEIQSKKTVEQKTQYLNKVDKTTFDGKFKVFSFDFAEYLTNKSKTTILIYTFIYVCVLIFIMDITVGVGRSRTEERRNKKLSST